MNTMGDVLSRCRAVLEQGGCVEDVVRLLRDQGLSKVHSMKMLVDLGLADLGEAKRIVHESATWGDIRARDDDFQRNFGES